MAQVDAAQVARLIDSSDTPGGRAIALANAAVPLVTAFAKAYTRGRGFDRQFGPEEEIAAVITTAAARFAGNTAQTVVSQSVDNRSTELRSFFTGWTLAELMVLNRYRVRAM
jgi:hypothetical protein